MQGEETQNPVKDQLKSIPTSEVTEGLLRGEKNGISDGPYTLDELMGEEFRPKEIESPDSKPKSLNSSIPKPFPSKHPDSLRQNTGIPTRPLTIGSKKIDISP